MTEIDHDAVTLLVQMGANDGGRINPERIAARPPHSPAVRAYNEAVRLGLLDAEGWVTAAGYEALNSEQAWPVHLRDQAIALAAARLKALAHGEIALDPENRTRMAAIFYDEQGDAILTRGGYVDPSAATEGVWWLRAKEAIEVALPLLLAEWESTKGLPHERT